MKKVVLILLISVFCVGVMSSPNEATGSDFLSSRFMLVSVFSLLFLLILLGVYVIMLQYRELTHKSQNIVRLKEKLSETEKNCKEKHRANGEHRGNESQNVSNEQQSAVNGGTEVRQFRKYNPVEHELFIKFDEYVQKERLYLDYTLGRDDYLRVMGVDKNKFGNIIKEYGGGNISSYLNNLRLEYSVQLLMAYNDLSINEIANRSAFPNTATYYRLFKEKYGISPNSYRNQS